MTLAILDCLNPECSMRKPHGYCVELSELPAIDPDAPAEGAQTDWPLCDACLEPMTLDEMVELDEEFAASLVNDAEERGGTGGVKRLVELATERLTELEATDQS